MRLTGTIIGFAAGILSGLAALHAAHALGGGFTTGEPMQDRRESPAAVVLAAGLGPAGTSFRTGGQAAADPATGELPYRGHDDASAEVAAARAAAMQDQKFLMVTFGANWCPDCRNLHRMLQSEDVRGYTRDTFRFVNVDVGKFDQNRSVAEDLGVSLSRGIPVAIFFDPHGRVIGTTNEGQLEPARRYTSKQILKFVRDIVERSRVTAPDSVD